MQPLIVGRHLTGKNWSWKLVRFNCVSWNGRERMSELFVVFTDSARARERERKIEAHVCRGAKLFFSPTGKLKRDEDDIF